MPSAYGRESQRATHLSQVLGILRERRKVTRPDLAEITGLSRTAIGTLVDELVRLNLVGTVGMEESSGGRPAAMLEFHPNAALALGADFVDNKWQLVAINLDAELVDHAELPVTDTSPSAVVNALKQAVEEFTQRLGQQSILPAIGVGISGQIDVRTGNVRSAHEYGWKDVPIKLLIEEALGIEALIANRSKVGALAELWHSRDQDKDLIYIFIGAEVVAGIAHAGELYMGSSSNAGELGHVTVLPDGPLCPCGNRGCLQELVSAPAIERLVRTRLRENISAGGGRKPEELLEPISVETVFKAAEAGDPLARQVVDEVAGYLGIAVANLVNLFNPELIILGGPVGHSGHVLVEPLQREVSRRATPYSLGMVSIASSELGALAGALGTAVMVLQQAARLLFAKQ